MYPHVELAHYNTRHIQIRLHTSLARWKQIEIARSQAEADAFVRGWDARNALG
jgi:hypothetical protein